MLSASNQRLQVMKILGGVVCLIFVGRLLSLQVFMHEGFAEQARLQQEKRSVLPARRGQILVAKNRLSSELVPLATNYTLKEVFVDPLILNYPQYAPGVPLREQTPSNIKQAAQLLAPILIHSHCDQIEGCQIQTDLEQMNPAERAAVLAYEQELIRIFEQVERTRVVIATDIVDEILEQISAENIRGLSVEDTRVVVNPSQVNDPERLTDFLAETLVMEKSTIRGLISRRFNRYQKLVEKVIPDISERLEELKEDPDYYWLLRGVGLREQHWRYYPEKTLAASTLGFVDSLGRGVYGLEAEFDHELQGRSGQIQGATSLGGGRLLLGQGLTIQQAQDGADLVLYLDRIIQTKAEKILYEDRLRFGADSGQIIVVEPSSGKILALAQSPDFDANAFDKEYSRYQISAEKEQADRDDPQFNQRIPTVTEEGKYFRFFNTWGPQVFRNKTIMDLYEPGSVIKSITMAAALQAQEVTPQTMFEDNGPVEVDEFEIRNSNDEYLGETSMLTVLEESLNTGIAFITQKMGSRLLYEYLRKFGFGQFLDVDLPGEQDGDLEHWSRWAESELVTRGFGQGLTATPLQVAMAFSTLANGGYLMKPLIVKEVRYPDGRVEKFSAEKIRRILSDQTYNTIKSMLSSAVSRGIARSAQVPGYSIMGKTGTSQTYLRGEAQEGVGTTITSFVGFAPFKNPQFLILVKYDYPRSSQWGSETAAITFRRLAAEIFSYLEIPPDR